MTKKINISNIVAYNQKKRRTRRYIYKVAKNIDEQTSRGEQPNG